MQITLQYKLKQKTFTQTLHIAKDVETTYDTSNCELERPLSRGKK